jgi:hypothetical protein
MKTTKPIRLSIIALIVMSLLFANTSSVAAGDGDGSGEVSVSATYPPRDPRFASRSLPGGGSATATASIIYNAVKVDGKAVTSLSSGVTLTYSICAQTVQVYRDGVPKGGAGMVCKSGSGGASISSVKTVSGVPYGHAYRADTYHQVSSATFNWPINLTVSANL